MITMAMSCSINFMNDVPWQQHLQDDLKLLRTDHLQGIQLLELRNGEYASLWIKLGCGHGDKYQNNCNINNLMILLQLPSFIISNNKYNIGL